RTVEDVWQLLIDGELPASAESREHFAREVRKRRDIPAMVREILPGIAAMAAGGGPLDGLRTAMSAMGSADNLQPLWDLDERRRRADLLRVAAVAPTLVAAIYRLGKHEEPIPPDPQLGHGANYLWMLSGTRPEPEIAKALEQYLILTVDHGFNSSTFTA